MTRCIPAVSLIFRVEYRKSQIEEMAGLCRAAGIDLAYVIVLTEDGWRASPSARRSSDQASATRWPMRDTIDC